MKEITMWSIPKIDIWLLFRFWGWLGITLYVFYYPVSFSLIGLVYYLLIWLGAAFTSLFLIPGIFFGPEYPDWTEVSWINFAARGRFFRKVTRTFEREFLKLKPLFYEKYDYENIHLNSDFKALRAKHHRKTQRENLRNLLYSDPQIRHRWRYKRHRDPKIQDLLKECQDPSWKSCLRFLSTFLFTIPAEDGVFLAPLYFIGINVPTAIVFALVFGFAHVRYSVGNCLQITASTILIIFLILPNYGLLTCIAGHVLYDLFCMAPGLILLPSDRRASKR